MENLLPGGLSIGMEVKSGLKEKEEKEQEFILV
jgi:hypothetical protein